MCSCNKTIEFTFEFEGVVYAYKTHADASAERRRLGATNSPIRQRKKVNA